MQIVSTWEREEIHLNNNEEALKEAGLAQALSVIYLLSRGSILINYSISFLCPFYNVAFVKNTQFYKLQRFPSQSIYFYKTVVYAQVIATATGRAFIVEHVEKAAPSLSDKTLDPQTWYRGKEAKHWPKNQTVLNPSWEENFFFIKENTYAG